MEQIRDLLDSALTQATFDIGRADRVYVGMLQYLHASPMTRIYPSGIRITYASRPGEKMSARQLREFASGDIRTEPDGIRARKAQMTRPDEAPAPLQSHLRNLLEDYVDPETDLIAHAFPGI